MTDRPGRIFGVVVERVKGRDEWKTTIHCANCVELEAERDSARSEVEAAFRYAYLRGDSEASGDVDAAWAYYQRAREGTR